MSKPVKYVALFRGINVGGHAIKMADLRSFLAGLALTNVETYIQSGNAIFSTNETTGLKETIERGFSERFGFESIVTLRSADELQKIVADKPFSEEEVAKVEATNPKVKHLYVYLLDMPIGADDLDVLRAGYSGPDKICLSANSSKPKREIYLLCHESVRTSKLALNLTKLKTPMTARNWRTIIKMNDMLQKP